VRTRYGDKEAYAALMGLGDRRSRKWDRTRKSWIVAGSRLLDLIQALTAALPDDAEVGLSEPLYVFSDCPNAHTTRGYLSACPECHSAVSHRAGVFVPASRVDCIAQCYEATGDDCNCLCLGLCHGLGHCQGPHKKSDWGKTVHRR
jgi:hypothetical protein